ncbi:MAG: hypothetical protein ACRD1X_18020 [Vicinamibacteria bacterium]
MAKVSQFPGGDYPLGDTVVYEGADTGWPPKSAMPQDWLYTIGSHAHRRGIQGLGQDWPYTLGAWRTRRRGMRGLGDDTPDSIRIYVPRLAAGLYAIDLYQTGLTPDSMPPVEPIATQRWNNRIATKFSQEARRLIGFVPVIHEPEGADVIYVHMAGATSHAEAERIWAPMQRALNQARTATGVGAPSDPYAAQPRAWETTPQAPGPGPMPERPRSVLDLVLGAAMVIGGIVLF